jgi:hypothetical protein
MSDTITATPEPRANRKKITYGTLWFCALIIGYIVVKGDPTSVIHTGALEYAFMLAGVAATGYSASAVADGAFKNLAVKK